MNMNFVEKNKWRQVPTQDPFIQDPNWQYLRPEEGLTYGVFIAINHITLWSSLCFGMSCPLCLVSTYI